jgi:4-amino-4-deoxy-L-arabinose transferase-like glycosyltransferase
MTGSLTGLHQWFPYLPVLLLLALLPFHALQQRPLWSDEAFTASYTAHPTPGLLLEDVRKNEETPPLYFLLLWGWVQLVGQSELALRLPSLLAGIAAVALFIFLLQTWYSSTVALIAGSFLAMHPLLAYYQTEARGYTLLMLMTIVCMAAFEYLLHHPQRTAARVGYVLAASLLFLTSYFSIVILVTHTVVWLYRTRNPASRPLLLPWLLIQGGIALIILPWLPSLLYQIQVGQAVTFDTRLQANTIYLLAMVLMTGIPPQSMLFVWLGLAVGFWALLLYGLLAPASPTRNLSVKAMQGHTQRRKDAKGYAGDGCLPTESIRPLLLNLHDPGSAGGSPAFERARCPRSQACPSPIPPLPTKSIRPLLLRTTVLPLVFFLLLIILLQVGTARYLLLLIPGIALSIAAGWETLRHRRPQTGGILGGCLLVGMLLYRLTDVFTPVHHEQAWEPFTTYIAQHADPEKDVVLFHPPWEQRTFEYYYQGPPLQLQGAHDYDTFYAVEGHDFATTWTITQAVAHTQDSQAVWLLHNAGYYRMHRLRLPYQLVGHWRSPGGLELLHYEVAPADPTP